MHLPAIERVRATYWAVRAGQSQDAGDSHRAEACIRLALTIASRDRVSDDRLLLRLWNERGRIAKSRGRIAAAARAYVRARAFFVTRRDPDARAVLFHNLAGLEHARGRFARAERLARRGLAIRTRLRGVGHPDVARDLAALAAILDGCGRHEEAERLHLRALAVLSRGFFPDRRESAAVLVNLAACLFAQGRLVEAEACGARAVAGSARALGPEHPETRIAVRNHEVIRSAVAPGSSEVALEPPRSG